MIVNWILNDYREEAFPDLPMLGDELAAVRSEGTSALDTARLVHKYMEMENPLAAPGLCQTVPYIGSTDFRQMAVRLQERRAMLERSFVELLGGLIADQMRTGLMEDRDGSSDRHLANTSRIEQAIAILAAQNDTEDRLRDGPTEHLVLSARPEIEEELSRLAREIVHDMGQVPSAYVSSALDLASGLYDSRIDAGPAGNERPAFSFYTYPEWDFRRSDYRQNWCTVKEMPSPPASGSFIQQTLAKYRGAGRIPQAALRAHEAGLQAHKEAERRRGGGYRRIRRGLLGHQGLPQPV